MWDRVTNTTRKLTNHTLADPWGEPHYVSQIVDDAEVTADGTKVIYSVTDHTTTPRTHMIKVWTRATGTTTTIAADGSRIAYETLTGGTVLEGEPSSPSKCGDCLRLPSDAAHLGLPVDESVGPDGFTNLP